MKKKQNESFPNRKIDKFGPEEDFLNVNRTLDCEDDARDLSIILTDKILNKFEKYGKVSIPLEKNYSFDLQDHITEIICKEYKIKMEK